MNPQTTRQAPIIEDGTIAGNYYDKYGSRNPIVRYLMSGFTGAFTSLLSGIEVNTVHEVGCGEGHLTDLIAQRQVKITASDFSRAVIDEAMAINRRANVTYKVKSVYDLDEEDAADLVVCCEVLEHLDDPKRALAVLRRMAHRYAILSVPREPIWRIMNMCRGKYLLDLGNTPGHFQHWSASAFQHLISRYFEIRVVKTPLPWTMLLCETN